MANRKKIKRIIKRALLGILGLIIILVIYMYFNLRDNKKPISPEITFISERPVMDGILDDELKEILPKRDFQFKFNINVFKGSAGSNYRLAYNTEFLYLYAEAKADDFICNDRGYQNGDGFILTLAKPKSNNQPADEYYEFGFSSQTKEDQLWAQKILWNYNRKVILSTLDDDVILKYKAMDGKIGFELLLPWSEVYPYHPWISNELGINLFFMKAHEGKNIPNVQGILFGLPGEGTPRKYRLASFEMPKDTLINQTYIIAKRNNIQQGDNIILESTSISQGLWTDSLRVEIYNTIGEMVEANHLPYTSSAGLNTYSFLIASELLPSGEYILKWYTNSNLDHGNIALSIFPEFDFEAALAKLKKSQNQISKGSYNSLKFYFEDINNRMRKLKSYETSPELNKSIFELNQLMIDIEQGTDVISDKTGAFRRAFVSDIDTTLRPYTIKVPHDYDPEKAYPLMVFLHGSGRTDENMFQYHPYLTKGDFIQIAPNARGISHYYGTQNALMDIKEAIDDASENYSIDPSKIILSGFSMGGYGVYRTLYEYPDLFKGIAIFSGLPQVGRMRRVKSGTYPDFMQQENLAIFKDIPIFISHGTKDLNCPYALTEEFVGTLKSEGARVTFFVDEGSGHSSPKDGMIMEQYYDWLYGVIGE